MIKAITFDLWNTLFENKTYAQIRIELFKNFFEERNIKRTHDEILESYNFAFSFSKEMLGKTNFRHNYVKDRITSMFNKINVDATESEIEDLREKNEVIMLTDFPPLKEGSIELLREFSKNYKIGLISDTGITPGYVIKRVFEQYGILKYFETTIFSDEIGFYKPCYIVFEKAMNNLKCLPQNSVHIGDLLETDIKGANDYKMKSVWLNEFQSLNTTEIKPTYEIVDIRELKAKIDLLN